MIFQQTLLKSSITKVNYALVRYDLILYKMLYN